MTVQPETELLSAPPGIAIDALAALSRAVAASAARTTLAEALEELTKAACSSTGAELALVRVLEPSGRTLEAVAVAGPAALVAELHGDRVPRTELRDGRIDLREEAPPGVRRVAERTGADAFLVFPVRANGTPATLELYRVGSFTPSEELVAELLAGQTALTLRAFTDDHDADAGAARRALELAGEALAAPFDETDSAAELVRLAAGIVGAPTGRLWLRTDDGALELAASYGLEPAEDTGEAAHLAAAALADRSPLRTPTSATVPLGEPPLGVLQLLFAQGSEPAEAELRRLMTFGARAAYALRTGARTRELERELVRSRTLLTIVGQATAELSLAHTLETTVARIAELFSAERVAVYLRAEEDRLVLAAGRGLTGLHIRVAERLLELGIGPARRWRPLVEVPDTLVDARLSDVRDAAREAGIDSALAVPLLVRDEVIGLLAVYLERGRQPSGSESALLTALAAQLAVAVQNARLHERTAELSAQREAALASEREAARRLGALYEISRSFAQSLSLDATLEALASTVVDVLDVDAAVIRMPDERREMLAPRAVHVKDQSLAEAVRSILWRPMPFGATVVQRLFRQRIPFRFRRHVILGEASELLEPFLEKGWTAAEVPVATPAEEVIASLALLSFRPGSPVSGETIDAAVAIAGQAALAIDNARLYQQQKEFADTMQRSLLPHSRPVTEGLEVGEVYESSARVDVGGDIYDFLALDDGRLAVVLGDVTGHGVEATADMAMAKFVFRSLAREHPEPADFLSAANDVIVDEIAPGKFITMAYLAIDGKEGRVACALAGHPAPRLLLPDGTVRGLESNGLVLGIDPGQRYEEVHADLPPGGTLIVYTDGVIEARRRRELYGVERLDGLLRGHRELPPHALARAIARDSRAFAGGELADDLAVVVIRRR